MRERILMQYKRDPAKRTASVLAGETNFYLDNPPKCFDLLYQIILLCNWWTHTRMIILQVPNTYAKAPINAKVIYGATRGPSRYETSSTYTTVLLLTCTVRHHRLDEA